LLSFWNGEFVPQFARYGPFINKTPRRNRDSDLTIDLTPIISRGCRHWLWRDIEKSTTRACQQRNNDGRMSRPTDGHPFSCCMEAADMGTTLNLNTCLLELAREAQSQGRTRDARNLLTRLVSFRDLPRPIAEQVHARLAEVFVAEKQFRKARRHLAVLMCLRPSEAKYFYQYAVALHRDPKGDQHRAAKYYHQALEHEPTKFKWWSNYGKLLIELGRTHDAVGALRQARELSPDDPVVIGRLIEALCLVDRVEEARTVLCESRFAHPRDGRYRKLWNDFQFRQAAQVQQPQSADDPVILPFVRVALKPEGVTGPGRIMRIDEARPANKSHRRSRTAQSEG